MLETFLNIFDQIMNPHHYHSIADDDNLEDSFVIVNSNNNNLDSLNKYVNPELMIHISRLQIMADNYRRNKTDNAECCVCLSENCQYIPISCGSLKLM